jgi:hypothetical protein
MYLLILKVFKLKLVSNHKILLFYKILGIEPVATFKMTFALCGEWRQGWTTLS